MVDLAGPWPVEVSINDEPVVDFEFGCDSDCDDECECESPVIDQEDQLPSVTDKGDADGILLSDVDTRPLPKSPRHSLRTSPMPSPQNSSSDLNVHNVDSKRSLDNCTSHFEHGVARAASHDYGSHLTAILSPKRSLSSAGTSGETSPISKGGQRSPLSNPSATNPNVRRQRRSFNA
ncbi:hypothetical protein SARC_12851 [Sphaeroforma arctica JP610]|uniref:Uncharacterized protein n=1 Tax=Sphaeroforma arctica JP610 TaxID=667725 RepID=A0A0L0FCZ2_9EUKA|nr:hypothetical protein SARC_12851 [Sphaeroforma arctica JP610]KNC74605.1 hypothetical protein SARC_12851 [Sphaeroforma arctica JP610]|eukprot:XP_014148507.1 hypothetical protein SARC_12851 [Sphaeroforma arctica JP610]